MAKLVGRNALVYIGGSAVPQRNTWSLDFDIETAEARVFGATTWTERFVGFRSWSGSVAGFYDDTDDNLVTQVIAGTKMQIVLYENRNTLTRYWYGTAIFTLGEEANTDDVISLDTDFDGDGALSRFAA